MTSSTRQPPHPPLVAIVTNVMTPYRLHLHRRIAAELPEIRLSTVLTHDQGDQPWAVDEAPEINPVMFGRGHAAAQASSPRHAAREWRKGGRIARWLREHGARAVVLQGYNDPGRLRIAAWCRAAGVPCFLSADSNIHADHARGWRRVAKRLVVGGVVRACAGVMPCGSAGAAYFARYGAAPARTYPFPYEPNYEAVRDLPEETIEAVRSRFGLDARRRRVMFCGRLVAVKGIDTAIDAFVRVADRRPDWDLLVVGDGPMRAELEARVPAPLRRRGRFIGFVGDPTTVAALFRASHLYMHPAVFEPWGIVIAEAAAAGLGVLCSSVAGAGLDLVKEGVNGALLPPGDAEAWSEALLTATEADRWAAWGAAAWGVLSAFRAENDPVAGLRQALTDIGLVRSRNVGGCAAPAACIQVA